MSDKKDLSRRQFIQSSTAAVAGLAIANSSASYAKKKSSNKINVAMMGTHSRGMALAEEFAKNPHADVTYICDVDKQVIEKSVAKIKEISGKAPKGVQDFRKALDDKNVDALVIATPDHWHAPASIMALQAGKHVYVEKPCSHNPYEGELLLKAIKKYKKIVQMGNQQRSSQHTIDAMNMLHDGIIGRPYLGKAWYANKRGPIGVGKEAPVPAWLDYELWQGPAPRTAYRDNVIHYNWHWFWRWGTGETSNNATHELDLCRWALKVDYPTKAVSFGGRYHYDDDWEFYDSQIAGFEFGDKSSIFWEGRSCNAHKLEGGKGRGATIYATDGTMVIDRNSHVFYDKDDKVIKEFKTTGEATMDTRGGGSMTGAHIDNFIQAILNGEEQKSPITEGHKTILMNHLANISQKLGRSLQIDPRNGRILDDAEAMKMWRRDYEPGWEPAV